MSNVHVYRDSFYPFTQTPNYLLHKEKRLSIKARYVYIYLLSLPPTWIMRTKTIINSVPEGKHSIYAAFKELEEHGFIKRTLQRKDGRICGTSIKVLMPFLDESQFIDHEDSDNQLTDFQDAVEGKHSKTDLSKTDLSKNEDINTPPTPQGGSEVEAGQAPARKPRRASTLSQADLALFEQWYGAYPRKVSRGDAEKAWRAITPSKALLEEMMAALAWQVQSHDWTKDGGSFIPYPATYLRAKKWMDQSTVVCIPCTSRDLPGTKSDVQDLLRQMGRI